MLFKCYIAQHHHKNNNKTKASGLAIVLVLVVTTKMSIKFNSSGNFVLAF